MELFTTLLIKLIPLYVMMFLGYAAGRWLDVKGHNIGAVTLYLLVPIIIFDGVLHTPLSAGVIALPLILFGISTLFCIIFLFISKRLFPAPLPNILGFMAGTGNAGYFALPVALMLFDDATLGIYITCILGFVIFESSIGYYVAAKGNYSTRECISKLLRLPMLYAFLIALVLNFAGITRPALFDDFMHNMQGAYTVFGMMIIGVGIANAPRWHVDLRFTALAFFIRFVAWPAVTLGFIALDQQVLGWLPAISYPALILISIVPLAANSVMFATLLNASPERVATTVLASTVFALVYIPLMVLWLMPV